MSASCMESCCCGRRAPSTGAGQKRRRRIAIFGSSLNPPTGNKGHRGLVSYFCECFDEVWVIPVYQHMFDEKRHGMAPFDDRMSMAELNFDGLHGVKVLDVERRLNEEAANSDNPESIGTVDVVRHLRTMHPEADFALILGGDTYEGLMGGKWKGGEELRSMVTLEITGRAGARIDPVGLPQGATLHLIDGLGDVSSTQARSITEFDALCAMLHPDVARYIVARGLYACNG